MSLHSKLLKLNGETVMSHKIDGDYWMPIISFCEAFKLDFDTELIKLKMDYFTSSVIGKQTILVNEHGKATLKEIFCMPERFIYGWFFLLSKNYPGIMEYNKLCDEFLESQKSDHQGCLSSLEKSIN